MFPVDLAKQCDDPRVAEMLEHESALFTARRRAFVEQSAMLHTDLARTRQEIAISAQMVQTMSRSHAMAGPAEGDERSVAAGRFVAATKVLDLQRTEAEALSHVQSGSAEPIRARQRQTDSN